jgi:hypothetical protein
MLAWQLKNVNAEVQGQLAVGFPTVDAPRLSDDFLARDLVPLEPQEI